MAHHDRSLVCLGYLGHEPPSISLGIMALSKGSPASKTGCRLAFFPIRRVVARLMSILATTFVSLRRATFIFYRPLFSIDLSVGSTHENPPIGVISPTGCKAWVAHETARASDILINAHLFQRITRDHVDTYPSHKYAGIAGLL